MEEDGLVTGVLHDYRCPGLTVSRLEQCFKKLYRRVSYGRRVRLQEYYRVQSWSGCVYQRRVPRHSNLSTLTIKSSKWVYRAAIPVFYNHLAPLNGLEKGLVRIHIEVTSRL